MKDPPPNEPAETLFRRARAGDTDAGRELLGALLPELQLFVRLHLGSLQRMESVSDVAQSVVGDLLPVVQREQFADLSGFRAWLRRCALNKITDLRRYHGAQRRNGAAEVSPTVAEELGLVQRLRSLPSPSQAAMGAEDAARLDRALLRLPEDQRQVVAMARLFGMPHKEIAEALGRSEVACRMLLLRGLRNLARELDVEDPARRG